jgi:hypothetical protein
MQMTLPACTQFVKGYFDFLVDFVPGFTDKPSKAMPEPVALSQSPDTKPPYTGKKRGGLSKGLTQAYELRDLAHKAAMQFKGFLPITDEAATASAREIAALIRAWSEADDHVRIHRNKPLPGSLRPVAKVKRGPKPSLAPVPSAAPAPVTPQEPSAAPASTAV